MFPPSPVRKRRWLIVVGVLVVLAAASIWCVRHLGEWLMVEDPLEPAQAIIVLSGDMPVRALGAADIYHDGHSAQVWLTRPPGPGEVFEQLHIDYIGEEFYSQKVLMARGVPADAIRVLENPAGSTQQEVHEIARELRQAGGDKVIIVTSKAHTRRVRALWDKLVGGNPQAIVRYAREDPFDAAHWWRRTSDALDVVREVLGLANVWAGFPLRSRS